MNNLQSRHYKVRSNLYTMQGYFARSISLRKDCFVPRNDGIFFNSFYQLRWLYFHRYSTDYYGVLLRNA